MRYLINVHTNWCGMDETYRAEAESELELDEIAEELAYNNFESYNGASLMAQAQGYDPEEMTEFDWERLYEEVEEGEYYGYGIEEFEGTEDEWEEYGGEIYGKEF